MGYRLSKIYTRTGDNGTTGLGDGTRVKKSHPRIHAIGEVDELNSVIGLLLVQALTDNFLAILTDIQNDLFDLGGELSVPGHTTITGDQVKRLETTLDAINADLPPLKEFILPGGSSAAAVCHLARSVCRRAERCVSRLRETETINAESANYLNRLSDLLFVLARAMNVRAGKIDVLWQPGKNV